MLCGAAAYLIFARNVSGLQQTCYHRNCYSTHLLQYLYGKLYSATRRCLVALQQQTKKTIADFSIAAGTGGTVVDGKDIDIPNGRTSSCASSEKGGSNVNVATQTLACENSVIISSEQPPG